MSHRFPPPEEATAMDCLRWVSRCAIADIGKGMKGTIIAQAWKDRIKELVDEYES